MYKIKTAIEQTCVWLCVYLVVSEIVDGNIVNNEAIHSAHGDFRREGLLRNEQDIHVGGVDIKGVYDDTPASPTRLRDVANWPGAHIRASIGQQASGVAMNRNSSLVVFYRGDKVWDDKYNATEGPISVDVFMVIDAETKTILDQFGAGMIYMPHGLTIDKDDNMWVTDVGAQQVLKIDGKTRRPSLVLGEKFVQGSDAAHFCNPTSVAVAANGDFFIADGYCNARILKFAANGTFLTKWGKPTAANATILGPYDLNLPHSLSLDEARDQILVADRENGRIQVYEAGLHGSVAGRFVRSYTPGRGVVFAIHYDHQDDVIYVVNGPGLNYTAFEGFTLDMQGNTLQVWKPTHGEFQFPHDLAVTRLSDQVHVFVGQVGLTQTQKLWQFTDVAKTQTVVGK